MKFAAKPAAALQLIEASHDGAGDLQAWADGLLAAGRALISVPAFNLGVARRHQQSYEVLAASSVVPGLTEYWNQQMASIDPQLLDVYVRHPHFVSSVAQIAEGRVPSELTAFLKMVNARDVLGVVALVDDVSLALGAPLDSLVRMSSRDRILLTQVGLHLECSLRLRLHPGEQLAILRPDGRVLDAGGAARAQLATREELSRHIGTVERSRTRARRQEASSVQAWSALVSGRWGLVERNERGIGRHYAVVGTKRARHLRALTEIETHAAELSARGLSGKSVAYALGVGPASVSKHLASAALKLGVSNRTGLVRLVARLLGTGPRRLAGGALTASESDVLALIHLGWSNAKIAETRGRSERTVANQVSSLLRKLELPSRRALATSA